MLKVSLLAAKLQTNLLNIINSSDDDDADGDNNNACNMQIKKLYFIP